MDTPARILALNSGSSSLKFALYDCAEAERCLASGAVEGIALPQGGRVWVRNADGQSLLDDARAFADAGVAVRAVFDVLRQFGPPAPTAVGHRVVFGGALHTTPARLDASLMEALRALVPFAPLHMPAQLAAIEAVAAQFPGLFQAVCFDTSFHQRMPEIARRFPLPRVLWDAGLRKYGFHGLSYEFIVGSLGAAALGRAVIAHLGHGASLAAVRDGVPIDTTMGLSPTGGVMMSTRSGDLDPSVLLYLVRERQYDARALEQLVVREAGLLGVSGTTADMQVLLASRASDPRAAQAVEMFCYQIRKQIGAFAAALGGLDTLVFAGGIGERAAPVRAEVCDGLAHLGVRIDPARNERHEPCISVADGPCTVRVIQTNENLVIARHTRVLMERPQ